MQLSEFKEHFIFFKQKILFGENFTLVRYGDGERMILIGESVKDNTQAYQVDKWRFDNNPIFTKDLFEASFHRESNYYYAISCKCCDPRSEAFYRSLFQNHNITYANIFVNGNYEDFLSFTFNLKREVVVIANKSSNKSDYPFNVVEKYSVENDCVNWYESEKQKILLDMKALSEKYKNTLFFVSAGPLSEILIHKMYGYNPNNSYIDVGSCLDICTHKTVTRPYQEHGNSYSKKECFF